MRLPEDVTLRPATDADGEAIRHLIFGVLREYGLQPEPDGTDADLFAITATYEQSGGWFACLVRDDGTVVGTVALFNVDAVTCELRKMYLAREVRGQGLGAFLLRQAIETARRLGFQWMVLETASVLKEAIALYERAGFQRVTQPNHSCRCDAVYRLGLVREGDQG
ncbi:MAG: GNAT family N-acetyltransferase [Chloracidobacterium sp.]|uniref:GNAT family N-acetyltransferase n=1 Tax=Chloracidobacterium validum TaxID=2821543 RepID=A0ABX8BAV0_9BACT|nr:GNAT family N-acetyltransferase [Chloracidobacterium validum]QUW04062.1 GNAT family N-acetyltransferase [Chloracidobacterium validum]